MVTHPDINPVQQGLTSLNRREPVFSVRALVRGKKLHLRDHKIVFDIFLFLLLLSLCFLYAFTLSSFTLSQVWRIGCLSSALFSAFDFYRSSASSQFRAHLHVSFVYLSLARPTGRVPLVNRFTRIYRALHKCLQVEQEELQQLQQAAALQQQRQQSQPLPSSSSVVQPPATQMPWKNV